MISRETILRGFPTEPLGAVAEFLDSRRRPITASKRIPGPYPYYGANGQQDSVADYIFDEPLILLAEDGGPFDQPDRGIAYAIEGKTWVNNHAHVLRPRDHARLRYLVRVLENYDVTPWITGSTRAKLTKAGASKIQVPLPPLAEQKRIEQILDTADALRTKRREALAQLDTLIRSTFLDMFGDPITNPLRWEKRKLSDLCHFRSGYAWKAKSFNSDGIGSPVVRIQNVGTESSKLVHTTEEPIERFWVDRGEYLLSLSGSFRLAIWNGPRALLNQRIVRLTPEPIVTPAYFGSALSTQLSVIEAMGRHALVNNVALSDLKEVELCLAPLNLQQRFSAIVESVEQQKASQRAHLAELDTLFASLQLRAFRGDL